MSEEDRYRASLRIDRAARAIYNAMLRSPFFAPRMENVAWDDLRGRDQSEVRAVAHSGIVATDERMVWTVLVYDLNEWGTCPSDEPPHIVSVASTRERAINDLNYAYNFGDELHWDDSEYPKHVYVAKVDRTVIELECRDIMEPG